MTIEELIENIKGAPVEEQLQILAKKFPEKIVFSTSFGQEDQVITDLICRNHIPIQIFTLDTGRLFEETYKVWEQTLKKYKTQIKAYYPDTAEVEKMTSEKGVYSFYESQENRKECCNIRKVHPLRKALDKQSVWITGLRAGQSVTRTRLPILENNDAFDVIKYNPLIDWTLEEILGYLKKHQVPYNKLHDKGFISIGCAPCTRAVKDGEDIRSGRWWWESKDKKECGLHTAQKKNPIIKFKIFEQQK